MKTAASLAIAVLASSASAAPPDASFSVAIDGTRIVQVSVSPTASGSKWNYTYSWSDSDWEVTLNAQLDDDAPTLQNQSSQSLWSVKNKTGSAADVNVTAVFPFEDDIDPSNGYLNTPCGIKLTADSNGGAITSIDSYTDVLMFGCTGMLYTELFAPFTMSTSAAGTATTTQPSNNGVCGTIPSGDIDLLQFEAAFNLTDGDTASGVGTLVYAAATCP